MASRARIGCHNFEEHLKPFAEGAFKLEGKTQMASAVMPYYTISYNHTKDGTNHANGFSKYIITDLLREKYKYDGVVCTDWLITADEGETPADFAGKPWGAEELSVAERHYFVIKAGVDQFGGNNEKGPILEAYKMGVDEFVNLVNRICEHVSSSQQYVCLKIYFV